MMTKRMTAIPTERSQLSNQRPSRDWRFSMGATGSGAVRPPVPARSPPKSSMPFTLPTPPAGRSGNRPSGGRSPAPPPIAERVRRVAMHYSGRQACRLALALDRDPRHRDVAQGAERRPLERRAAERQDDDQRFVIHRTHVNASGVRSVTFFLQSGSIPRTTLGLGVDLGALQPPGEVDVHDLRLRIEIVHLPAALPVPVARLLHAAERQEHLCPHGPGGVRGDAPIELAHSPGCGVYVPGAKRSEEPLGYGCGGLSSL